MTRKRAIEVLEYIRHTGNGESEYTNCSQSVAIDMAIKELEQETVSREVYEHEYFLRKEFELKIYKLQRQLEEQALEQEQRWIPVTESTPPKGTICLWCNKQGSVFTSEITCRSKYSSYVGKHGYFSNGLKNHGNIIAWQPLPKPCKAESEDKK